MLLGAIALFLMLPSARADVFDYDTGYVTDYSDSGYDYSYDEFSVPPVPSDGQSEEQYGEFPPLPTETGGDESTINDADSIDTPPAPPGELTNDNAPPTPPGEGTGADSSNNLLPGNAKPTPIRVEVSAKPPQVRRDAFSSFISSVVNWIRGFRAS